MRASHCDDGQCLFPRGILVLHDFCFIVDFRIELLPLPRYDSTHLCSYVDDTFKGVSVNGAHAGSRECLEIIAHEEELREPACTVQRKGDRIPEYSRTVMWIHLSPLTSSKDQSDRR